MRKSLALPALAVAGLFQALSLSAGEKPATLPSDYKLLYEQKFDVPAALKDFLMTDTAAWKWTEDGKTSALELVQQSKYEPVVRSPVNIALIADKVFTDFVLEADLIQTGKEYGHRDMCLFFGFQNPTNFYYTHIATAADDHAPAHGFGAAAQLLLHEWVHEDHRRVEVFVVAEHGAPFRPLPVDT